MFDFASMQRAGDESTLLTGRDATPRILAVEPAGGAAVCVYRRDLGGQVVREEARFHPWLIATRPQPWAEHNPSPEIIRLNGAHPLRYLVRFGSWAAFQEAARTGRESRETFFSVNSLVDQYLIDSGRTLFKDMVFEDLRRVQIDIETTGLDPLAPNSRIVIAALRLADGEVAIIEGRSEEAILVDLTEAIRRLDPDVIEGHNVFNFDLPFIVERAARWSVALRWGRDGSPVRLGPRRQRVKIGPLSFDFQPAYVFGRHVIDTYQQIQRYDIGGHLTSYGLKSVIEALGLTRSGREFLPGDQIADIWRADPDRLRRYVRDDVVDVDLLSRLALPTEFYQTQLLPRTFQQVATAGPGTKINDLMLRAYVSERESLPLPDQARDYPGGHAELLATGVFSPVVKCDVESLYPSIMLSEGITSSRDTLGVYLPMLRELTRRRLHAKARSRSTGGQERAVWDGLQASFKVLINSFYGYLGFGGALFNDFEAATAVTLEGQRLIKSVVASIDESGGRPIEVDTDGVYFVPPASVRSESEELHYVALLGGALPEGIRLTHDGRFRAMLSLRLKNYALLGYDDRITLKGSALRSRRLEPFVREFLLTAARAFMENRPERARDAYFELAALIRARSLPIERISQTVTIHADTIASQPRLRRLLDRLPEMGRESERIQVYERDDGELALVQEYAGDENLSYLLRRLSDSAGRFDPLFPSPRERADFFPPISLTTDIDAAKEQQTATQLNLF